jgi:hypothetical protein
MDLVEKKFQWNNFEKILNIHCTSNTNLLLNLIDKLLTHLLKVHHNYVKLYCYTLKTNCR